MGWLVPFDGGDAVVTMAQSFDGGDAVVIMAQ